MTLISKASQSRWAYLMLLLGCNIVCVGVLAFSIAAQPALRNFLLFYCDNITLPLYFKSLIVHHEALSGFMYGTQGFFFPGYPLYLISYVISFLVPGDHYAASLIVMALLQVVCFDLALFYLGLAVFRSKRRAALFAGVSVLLLTLLLILGQRLPMEGWFPTDLFLTSTHHIAIALGVPLFLAGVINYFRSKKKSNLIFIILLSAVILPSDSAWSTWFLISFLIALLLLFLFNYVEKRFFLLVVASTIASAVLGKLIDLGARHFFHTVKPFLISSLPLSSILHDLKQIVLSYAHDGPVLCACVIIAALCCAGLFMLGRLIYQTSRAKDATEYERHSHFPLLMVLLHSCIAGLVIVAATMISGNANVMRYYSLFVVFALFALIPLLATDHRFLPRASFAVIVFLCGAILASPAYIAHSSPVRNPAYLQPDDLVSRVATKNLSGDFIGDYVVVSSLGLYTSARAIPLMEGSSLTPTLQNVNDLKGASLQNLIVAGPEEAGKEILSQLPAGYQKMTFQAYTYFDKQAPVTVYHWQEPINHYLGN